MTEPVITVGEITRFCEVAGIKRPGLGTAESADLSKALAAFLKARVPKHQPTDISGQGQYNAVWNACIDRVMKGKE